MTKDEYPHRLEHRDSGVTHIAKCMNHPFFTTACGIRNENPWYIEGKFKLTVDDAEITCVRCRRFVNAKR